MIRRFGSSGGIGYLKHWPIQLNLTLGHVVRHCLLISLRLTATPYRGGLLKRGAEKGSQEGMWFSGQ
jgi:hypothetical protein